MAALPCLHRGGSVGRFEGPRSPLVLCLALAAMAVPLASCRMDSPPVPTEVPPEVSSASADLYALARLHPAWAQAEAARQALGLGSDVDETVIEAMAVREMERGDPAPGPRVEPGDLAEPPGEGDTPSVGEALESVLDQHYRRPPRDPISGGSPSMPDGEEPTRPAPPTGAWAASAESEARAHLDLTFRGEVGAGAARDPSQARDDIGRLTRLLELEARAAEARARAQWDGGPLDGVGERGGSEQQRGEAPPPAADRTEFGLAVARDLRLREIARELAAEARSEEEFREGLDRSSAEQAPRQLAWKDLAAEQLPEAVGATNVEDPLAAERAALIERYVEVLETIVESTRRDAATVARSAGLELRFDGRSPDRTAEVADLLARFYGRVGTGMEGATEGDGA